jgi:uncharacterized protein YfcZ (UPF0381/DUF406 family)
MRLTQDARRNRSRLERSAAKANAAFDRAYQLYINGVTDGPKAQAAIRQLQEEARAAEAVLAQADESPKQVELHPASLERYITALSDLSGRLHAHHNDAVIIIRELVSAVRVTPTDAGLDVVVEGFLGAILGETPKCRVLMVAEVRSGQTPTLCLAQVSLRRQSLSR